MRCASCASEAEQRGKTMDHRKIPPLVLAALLVAAIAATATVASASRVAQAPAPAPVPEGVAPDSPRASVIQFLALCRKGDFAPAAQYLEVPDQLANEKEYLARRLFEVLDRVDVKQFSPLATGDPNDQLAPGVDSLGSSNALTAMGVRL